MDCPIPSPLDVRHYLEGYCLETQDVLQFTEVSFESGVTEIDLGSSVSALRVNMPVSGTGIVSGTRITEVDYDNETITIDTATSEEEDSVTLSITKNIYLTDEWIINRRDRLVIPWIEKRTSLNIRGDRTITEYISGNGLTSMILSHHPVQELVSMDYVSDYDDVDNSITSLVEVDNEQGILISKNRIHDASDYTVFRRGVKNIKVVYTIGYEDICSSAPDVPEAIVSWLAALCLQMIGARTGGGNISQSGFSQSYGDRGKYTEIIQMSEANAMAILRNYFEYTVAP